MVKFFISVVRSYAICCGNLTQSCISCPAETEMKFGGLISTSNIVKGEKITIQSDSDLLWTINIKKL